MSSTELFDVQGLVAVITGGGTGFYFISSHVALKLRLTEV
jgi:hypothetical protein